MLNEGGYLCTVVDDGLLSNIDPHNRAVRETILERVIVRAVVSLPDKTFKSKESGVKPSILLLRKKKAGLVQGKTFMTHVEHVGIDASGNIDKDQLEELTIPSYRKWRERT
jgi:type I restriction enzyme M protein